MIAHMLQLQLLSKMAMIQTLIKVVMYLGAKPMIPIPPLVALGTYLIVP